MANILAFISKYHRFLVFVILELISLSLVFSFNRNQGTVFMTWRHEISGRVYSVYNDVNYYFHLKDANDSLLAENARLHTILSRSKYGDTSKASNIEDTVYKQKFTYIPAKVINNSVTLPNNYLTISRGKNDHVNTQQAVISPSGIIGIVNSVSSNFASVMSILNSNFTVSAEIAELKEIGSVVWDRQHPDIVIMKDIPIHVKIKNGMHVVTSPYSDIFPDGSTIGTIESFSSRSGDAHYTIKVKLASDLRNIRQVYVVTNLMKAEQHEVEKGREEDK